MKSKIENDNLGQSSSVAIELNQMLIKKIKQSLDKNLKIGEEIHTVKEWLSSVEPIKIAGFQAAAIASNQEDQLVFLGYLDKYVDLLQQYVDITTIQDKVNGEFELHEKNIIEENQILIKGHDYQKECERYRKQIQRILRESVRCLDSIWGECVVESSKYQLNFSLTGITEGVPGYEKTFEEGKRLIKNIGLDIKYSALDPKILKRLVAVPKNMENDLIDDNLQERSQSIIVLINTANQVLTQLAAAAVSNEGIQQVNASSKPIDAYKKAVEKWALEVAPLRPELWCSEQALFVKKMKAVAVKLNEWHELKPKLFLQYKQNIGQSNQKNSVSSSSIDYLVSPRYHYSRAPALKEPESSHSVLLSPRFEVSKNGSQQKNKVVESTPSTPRSSSIFSLFSFSNKPAAKHSNTLNVSDNPVFKKDVEKLMAVTIPPSKSEIDIYLDLVCWVRSLENKVYSEMKESVLKENDYKQKDNLVDEFNLNRFNL